jgi:hypothetical protein
MQWLKLHTLPQENYRLVILSDDSISTGNLEAVMAEEGRKIGDRRPVFFEYGDSGFDPPAFGPGDAVGGEPLKNQGLINEGQLAELCEPQGVIPILQGGKCLIKFPDREKGVAADKKRLRADKTVFNERVEDISL